MAVARRALIIGGGIAAGIAALVYTSRASAEELEPGPVEPIPDPPANPVMPADRMPWGRPSDVTKQRQQEYNAWASANGWPTIDDDGVLGSETCAAFTDWWANGGPAVPAVCGDIARRKICNDALAYENEWRRLERMRTSGDPFYGESQAENQAIMFRAWQKAKLACEG